MDLGIGLGHNWVLVITEMIPCTSTHGGWMRVWANNTLDLIHLNKNSLQKKKEKTGDGKSLYYVSNDT